VQRLRNRYFSGTVPILRLPHPASGHPLPLGEGLGVRGQSPSSRLTSYVLRLTVLALFAFHFLLLTEVHAAPHITKRKNEPPSKVGEHIRERLKARAMVPSLMKAGRSYTNPVNILFLRVDFQEETTDDSTTTGNGTWTHSAYACTALGPPVSTIQDCIDNPSDYWVNKARARFISYYNEVSYGALQVQVEISASVYRLDNQMAYYGADTPGSNGTIANLIRDAVTAADGEIDFSQYDAVLVVHAGAGEETDIAGIDGDTPNDIWSLYYSNSGGIVTTNGGVPITEGIIMPQVDSQDGIIVDPLGVYTHEFGHWLGLPDLYDTDSAPDWDGVGKWSLMGDGIYNRGSDGILGSSPAHPDAWCKTYLGWVTPQEFLSSSDPGSKSLSPIESAGSSNQVFKLQASTTTSSQYFLLENRQRTAGASAFDYGLPWSGMLVWLIDDAIINADIDSNTVNNNPLRPGVKLIEADGNNDLRTYGGDFGGSGDPFPGTSSNTSFTLYTDPASTPYIGDAWLYLKDIAAVDSDINLTIGFAPTPPGNLAATHNSATVLTWTANTEADLVSYNIYRNGIFLESSTPNQYTDTSSTSGDIYSITAVDTNGYESARSTAVTVTFSAGGGGGGGGGGCFIATAAYGSYEAPYVKILREFRDRFLISNSLGSYFVKFYYWISPPIADFISGSEVLRAAVRVLLLPFIGMAAFLVKTSFVQKILFGLLGALGLFVYRKEK